MKFKAEMVGPKKAAALLEKNEGNRPQRERWVDQLAIAIQKGEWKENGETIKVSKSGRLVDGQHRLLAIIRAGIAVKMTIAYEVDEDAFDTIDQGRGRTSADVLARHGEKNYKTLAGALAWLLRMKSPNPSGYTPYRITELLHLLFDHPQMRDAVDFAFANSVNKIISSSMAAALLYHFRQINKDDADSFMVMVASGEHLKKTDPAYVLRERLIENKGSKTKLPAVEICALVIKAWNFYRHGKTCKCLKWTSRGNSPEQWPQAV